MMVGLRGAEGRSWFGQLWWRLRVSWWDVWSLVMHRPGVNSYCADDGTPRGWAEYGPGAHGGAAGGEEQVP